MKSILIYSGGMDSTVLLYQLCQEGGEVRCLGINYGQRHRKELEVAGAICKDLGVEYCIADLSGLRDFLGGSSQTDSNIPVPEGHYEEESMKLTVVPNRNMIMLAVAAGWAISLRYDRVAYAAHAGDRAIYPDCRQEFATVLDSAIQMADWHKVHLYRPFATMTKAQICKLGLELDVPFEKTWSCYVGGERHCGRCGTCTERREAFQLARVFDLTEYE